MDFFARLLGLLDLKENYTNDDLSFLLKINSIFTFNDVFLEKNYHHKDNFWFENSALKSE